MKNDDFDDKLCELAEQHRTTRWWRPIKAWKLRREIHRRWNHFIKEISGESEDAK